MSRGRGVWVRSLSAAVLVGAAACGRIGFEAIPGDGGGQPRLDAGADGGGSVRGGFGDIFDFDVALDGWAPTDNDSPPGFRSEGGPGVFDEWWTPPDDGDREIAVYRTSHTSATAWGRSFRNDSGRRIVGVRIRYAMRIHHARFQGAESGAAEFGLREAQVAWAVESLRSPDALSPTLTNRTLGPALDQRWIDEEEATDASLVRRNVVDVLTGIDVAPGDSLRLEWGPPFIGTEQSERHLTVGIDDVVVAALYE